jgi:hypothetical protein
MQKKIILSIYEEQFLLSPISLYIIRVVSILKQNKSQQLPSVGNSHVNLRYNSKL